MATLTDQKVLCDHCGLECRDTDIHVDGKHFCCQGCKMVYELLNEHDLCTYYNLESHPGNTIDENPEDGRFEYLDHPDIINKLLEFDDGKMGKVTFFVPQIHCKSCIWLLENMQRLSDAIMESRVDFLRREVSITYQSDSFSLRKLVELLTSIGYEPQINLDQVDKKHRDHSNRDLYLKLGVAGFAFGNIMLFSLPAYFTGFNLSKNFTYVFNALNVLLALPVLFYSSTEYLKSAWIILKQKRINMDVPVSIGIIALFARSLYEILSGAGPGYMDSFSGLVFFLLIGKVFQRKTYDTISFDRDYKSYFPVSVRLKNGHSFRSVPVSSLNIGDAIQVRNKELVPSDSVLDSDSCLVDFSFVTGESTPIEKSKGDLIFAGGRIIGKAAEMFVSKEVSQSYLTRLWNNDIFQKENEKKNIITITDQASVYFTLAVILIASLSGLYWWRYSPHLAVNAFTSVLIIACPCALALAAPFTLGSAMNIFGRSGLFLKNTTVIERLSGIKSIIFDKTGTLTRSDKKNIEWTGSELTQKEKDLIYASVAHSTHPLSRQIHDYTYSENKITLVDYDEIEGNGIRALSENDTILIGSYQWMKEHHVCLNDLSKIPSATTVYIAINGILRGYFELTNSYREGLADLMKKLSRKITLRLLSGDNDHEKEHLLLFFGHPDQLKFKQSPEDKLTFIRNRQVQGEPVMMIGDGLNDAGALRQSDVGIAITDNIGAFSPACDAVLEGSQLTRLDTFLRFSRASMIIIFISYGISLAYNLIGLGFAVQGILSPLISAILMPISSISVIIFTTSSTYLVARKMGLSTWK